jgi:ATP-dependent exoDNAse (exonuclease V) beta subunit
MKRVEHNNDAVLFDPIEHKYALESTKEPLRSATQIVHSYFPEFQQNEISKKLAVKYLQDQDAIIENWTGNCMRATGEGSMVHKFAENMLRYHDSKNQLDNIRLERTLSILNGTEPSFERVRRLSENVHDFIRNSLLPNYNIISLEQILFSPKYKMAGTADVLATPKDYPETLCIFDWKTNKEITDFLEYKRYGKPPLESIEDTTHNHYVLQLNVYKFMIEEENYYDSYDNICMAYFHITDDGIKPEFIDDRKSIVKEIV